MLDLARVLPFAATCGLRVVQADRGLVELRLPLDERVLSQVGTVQAGAIFALAEIAAGVILAVNFGVETTWLVNREASIRYLRPARTDLVARATLSDEERERIRAQFEETGAVDCRQASEVFDATGRHIAEFDAIFALRPLRA